MPRDGSMILSDARVNAHDRLRAVRPARALSLREAHGGARRRETDGAADDARRLPKGEGREHLRSMQGGLRGAHGWLAPTLLRSPLLGA
jgi:hypothetical protein